MTAAAAEMTIRDEIRALIDDMPERKLYALRELLNEDTGNEEYWRPVIETDLTGEERADLAECRKQHREHPETFTPWEDFLKELSAAKRKDYTLYGRQGTEGGGN